MFNIFICNHFHCKETYVILKKMNEIVNVMNSIGDT